MKTLRVALLCLLLSCFLQTSAHAGQEKQVNQAPTGLSLEITYFKGRPPAYQTALDATESDAGALLDTLRQQVSELSTEAEPEALYKLLADFPAFTGNNRREVKDGVEMLMFDTRKDALKSIDEFRQKQNGAIAKEALRAWLTTSKDNYQKWIERLKKL